MTARWRIATPRSRPAALAAIDLGAETEPDLEAALHSVVGASPPIGRISLRPIAGVDHGLVARVSGTRAVLMPHGGAAVLDAIADALARFGYVFDARPTAQERFPEAENAIAAEALLALARAPSSLAVGLLLDQAQRWGGVPVRPPNERDRRLQRLIDPPVVAAVGPANVGKSSLMNALLGRSAALVADEPGTTRDHVGALVDLAGLVVHWVDTPGRRQAEGPEAEAIRAAEPVIEASDVVLAIGDARSLDPRLVSPREPDLVVAARSDLGTPGWASDLAVSVSSGAGLVKLVQRVRDHLVPPADLSSPDPWRFWA